MQANPTLLTTLIHLPVKFSRFNPSESVCSKWPQADQLLLAKCLDLSAANLLDYGILKQQEELVQHRALEKERSVMC